MILSCWKNEIYCIHEEIRNREIENSDGNSDIVLGVKNRKIRIIDNEFGRDNDASQDSNNLKWSPCEESQENV